MKKQSGIDLLPVEGAIDRRRFLQVTALGSVGFIIGCSKSEPVDSSVIAQRVPLPETASDLNAFVRVGSDNTVTVIIKHLDKGQGVTTGLPAIVAEELDADWSQMRTEFAPADASRYRNLMFSNKQGTGGSTSLANSWMQLREAAAGARDMLVRAAAAKWDIAVGEIEVSEGVVQGGGNTATFGELAHTAGTLSAPDSVSLKDPSEFKIIGTNVPRTDSNAKTDGSARFTIDYSRPDMQIAVVARPPRFGGRVASYDDSKALQIDGVQRVVEIPRGVAVLADSYYAANKGRQVLVVEWDDSDAEMRSSETMRADYAKLLDQPGATARNDGDAEQAFKNAAATISADFEMPYLAHAAMEPLDCLVELGPDRCEVWTASQQQSEDLARVAEVTGLDPSNIIINTVIAGGSFGRRAPGDGDFVVEAVSIAKAIDGANPVKLQWSREDDMSGGRYRPMASHRLRAAISDDGRLIGWDQRIVSQSILKGTSAERFMKDGIDPTISEGSQHLPYAIENFHLDMHIAESAVPVLWWRSVGHSHNAYASEVFFDQVAVKMGRDPYELRCELLEGQERFLGVLKMAAENAGWGTALPKGRGRGIALQKSFATYVAEVAEVTVTDDGDFTVDRIVCAVDCGVAVTPDVIRAQMEGGIGYGLSAAMREEVTLADGVVEQQNFHQYRPLRINEMPLIEVHIVESNEAPSGVGEPGLPPAAPAVANAIANATGTFITRLPFADQLKNV